MRTHKKLGAVTGTLLLVPLLVLAGCEGYDEVGQEGEEVPGQAAPGEPGEARPGESPEAPESETMRQRREAEMDRPAPPLGEEGAVQGMPEGMQMTDFSVRLPQEISAGTYTLSCPVSQEGPGAPQAGQATGSDVQLHFTLEPGAAGEGGSVPR